MKTDLGGADLHDANLRDAVGIDTSPFCRWRVFGKGNLVTIGGQVGCSQFGACRGLIATKAKRLNLRPFFTFYGGKWRAARHYPSPLYDHIVEPFAGSAGYSMRYPERNVTLVERDPLIAATWRYLLNVRREEILGLPDIQAEQSVDDLGTVCQEARLLIGWWLNGGSAQPKKRPSRWMRSMVANGGAGWTTGGGQLSWGRRVRERIAEQLSSIRHWTLIEGGYESAPDVKATWFIDPPYQIAGKHYRFGCEGLDYARLAEWCAARRGQVMVCENVGADWLPFRPWRDIKASDAKHGGKVSHEAIWTP